MRDHLASFSLRPVGAPAMGRGSAFGAEILRASTKLNFAAALLLLAACSEGTTYFDQMIGATERCAECSVEAELLWRSDADDPNVTPAAFFLEHRNSLWAMGGFAREKITRYDLDGGESRRFGTRGEGPGEIEDQIHAATLDPSGDTLVIAQARRVEYFSMDIQTYRSFQSPVSIRGAMVSLQDGTLVMADSRGTGHPAISGEFILHRFSPTGDHIVSSLRLEPRHRGAHVWLARGYEPRSVWLSLPIPSGRQLLQWDFEADSLVRQFSITPDWWYEDLRSAAEAETDYRSSRPSTGLTDFFDDGTVLWLSVGHADPQHETVDREYFFPSRLLDTVLLAVDRDTGRVLSGTGFDEFGIGFTNVGNLVLYSQDEVGRPRIELRGLHFDSNSGASE